MEAQPVWPLGLFILAVVGTFVGMMVASWLLGERHREPSTAEPYEGGILSTGDARLRFAPHFYLMGMLFVIFDVEAVFLFAWAVAARESGWAGYFEVTFFIFVLVATLVWLVRVGALDWGATVRRIRHAPPTRPVSSRPVSKTQHPES